MMVYTRSFASLLLPPPAPHLFFSKHQLTSFILDLIGNITVIVPPTHNFGPALHWTYVASLNKRVCSVDLEIQVIFGNKGDNLTFKSLVNGKAIGSARIEFA